MKSSLEIRLFVSSTCWTTRKLDRKNNRVQYNYLFAKTLRLNVVSVCKKLKMKKTLLWCLANVQVLLVLSIRNVFRVGYSALVVLSNNQCPLLVSESITQNVKYANIVFKTIFGIAWWLCSLLIMLTTLCLKWKTSKEK